MPIEHKILGRGTMPRRTTEADYRQRILRVEQHLEARLEESIEPAELARIACFSLHHFHRIFRGQLGQSLMQYVRRLRLEKAARKLRTGHTRILDLALEAGYGSHEAFTRAFVERFGTTPSHYRDTQPARLALWSQAAPERPRGEVRVIATSDLQVAFMRHRGSYARVGETWQAMLAWTRARGVAPNLYGLCPDDPDVTEEENLRFDACAVTTEAMDLPTAVIPGGRYAVAIHRGAYSRLHETYLDLIGRWLPQSGYEPAAEPVVEHYRNDPNTTAVADLETEVRVRLE